MNPLGNVLNQIQMMLDQFIWSSYIGVRSRNWVKWQNKCVPEDKGGLGFRMLKDVSMDLFCKLCWNFRTKRSIWTEYIYNKYCKKEHPNKVM